MSNITRNLLEQEGYLPTDNYRILAKPTFISIDYSDGNDTENFLLETLKSAEDVSVLSEELMIACKDWVSTYHFSHTRANLLRPFKDSLTGSVLELGAGCGAVTRFLGETAQEVVAVEGSLKRCEINAERVRDLENTTIVASEISEFRTAAQFDAVVVVGVLEYAAMFIDSDAPHRELLEMTSRFLKPGGILLLAIENKFGLKYFAGAPEDHVGKPMFGIENKYKEKGVRTFSRPNLVSAFKESGYLSVHTHAPLPDYKIVRGLVSHQGLESPAFPSGEMASQLSAFDQQLPRELSFDLAPSWLGVGAGGLDTHLSNSYLVEAKMEPFQESTLKGNLAFWYGADRKPQFLKEKTFTRTSEEGIVWVKETYLSKASPKKYPHFNQTLLEPSKFLEGGTFASIFADYLKDSDWSLEGLAEKIKFFVDQCRQWANQNGHEWPKSFEPTGLIDGALIDLLPKNVKTDGVGFYPFDLEWTKTGECSLDYFVSRVCLDVLTATKISMPESGDYWQLSVREAWEKTLLILGLTKNQIENSLFSEMNLQAQVSMSEINLDVFNQILARKLILPTHNQELQSVNQELQSVNQELQSVNQELQSVNQELQSVNQELQSVNQELLSSTSWTITRPLRQASTWFRQLKSRLLRIGKK
jgi:SAM-dependent methyltransferase